MLEDLWSYRFFSYLLSSCLVSIPVRSFMYKSVSIGA